MNRRTNDWKEIADSFYEKSFTLAILFLLFSFLAFPKLMEVKPYHKEVKIIEYIDIEEVPPKPVEPPEDFVRPQINIAIDDEITLDDKEVKIIDSITSTLLPDWDEPVAPQNQQKEYNVYQEAPVVIKHISPVYPKWAKLSDIEGKITLEVEVLQNGKVGEINVLKSIMESPNAFDTAAVNAVKKWEFQPAKSNGKPVHCWIVFDIDFKLD
jgi:TonB family protein